MAVVPNPAQAAIFAPSSHGKSGIPAGSQELGAVAHNRTVHAAVALAPRDAAALAAYAEGVATPGSPLYRHYLNVSEFAARFAPTAAQVAAVRTSLVKDGLTPGKISANGLTLPVTASAGTVETAFSTSLRRFALPNGQTGFANTNRPSIDPSVAGLVQGIVGLNTLAPTTPRVTVAHAKQPVGHAASAGADGQGCSAARTEATSQASYTTSQIAARYHLNDLYAAGIQGGGVTVAVYELEPFSSSDVAAFQSCFHTSSTVSTVGVDGGAGSGSGSGEAAMDIEDVIGLAPHADVRVYEGPATGGGAYDTYARIVSDNVAKVVTTSWGLCEGDQSPGTAAAESTLFQEAAAQGQTILASTGDIGSNDCSNHRQSVDDPASQPWVTGVGASSIHATGETVWNNSYGATGGGVSSVWARPAYQAAAAQSESSVSCGAAGTTCREVPDVTANGDPNTGYVIYYNGQWNTMGGTSISTPTWAALTALADSSPACAGHPVGFANPALYKLAATAYGANFGDVTSGANGYDHVAGFSAGPGYDMASGLGTPNGRSIVPALCGGAPIPAATTTATTAKAKASATAAATGLPASAITLARLGTRSSRLGKWVQVRLRARDGHGLAMRYSATGLPRGLKINSRTGVIAGRAKHAGTRRVTVRVSDGHGGFARASFRWRVLAPRHRA
ncbi:MAG TPA: protease pro-enzyme activation domain-containing protein [Solirubrobacteraceae bacterium]|nr:protease pro-enzyme activation domain-containing protein [Solirubrobacteraceae bacterium]